jgi:hypothetical protein
MNLDIKIYFRIQLKCDGTRCRTGGEVKGKLPNAVGSQYPSHYVGTRCIQHYYRWCRIPRGCRQSNELTPPPPGRFKWTRSVSRERRNLVSAHVSSYFNWPSHFRRCLPRSVQAQARCWMIKSSIFCKSNTFSSSPIFSDSLFYPTILSFNA